MKEAYAQSKKKNSQKTILYGLQKSKIKADKQSMYVYYQQI